jgi:hypothetical protein
MDVLPGQDTDLHFAVYGPYLPQERFDVSATFQEAGGQSDARGGLVSGSYYEALPY